MNTRDMRPLQRIRTLSLQNPVGITADPKLLQNRKEGLAGTLASPIKDHEGAWWVYDPKGTCSPYWYFELTFLRTEEQLEIFGDIRT